MSEEQLDAYTAKARRVASELVKEGEYELANPIFNANVLHPLPQKIYWREMATVHLEKGDRLVYKGTAKQLDIYGDTHPDNPIFKPGEEVRERNKSLITGSDLLCLNPYACGNLQQIEEQS